MKKCLLLIISIFFVTQLYAITNTWEGDENNLWSNPDNWSQNHVPLSSEEVIIPGVYDYYPYLTASGGYTGNCFSIDIMSGAQLRIGNGILNVTYDMTIYGKLWFSSASAVVNVNDDIIWESGATENLDYGTLNVKGDWT